eukprot:UN11118
MKTFRSGSYLRGVFVTGHCTFNSKIDWMLAQKSLLKNKQIF